jgi:signal transduction histidine kinase
VELYAPAAHARDITLQLRIDGQARPVHTNRPAIKIILSALLDNAIKYGPSGRPVVIVCRFGDWRVELEVYDEGRGVATDERERVFDRFYRGTSPREVSGSGLGLYGVRILAAALGGDAEVDSRPARGCCVRAWLPFSGAA